MPWVILLIEIYPLEIIGDIKKCAQSFCQAITLMEDLKYL
jgi:hypothetical protein